MNSFYQKNITMFDKLFYQTKQKSLRRNFISVTVSIVVAMLISFIIIAALGTKPAAFFSMFSKVFAWDYNSQQFAVQLCTYIIAALAFSFSMKVGIFNIGISGQMMAGGSFAFLILSNVPANVNVPGGQMITILLCIVGSTAVALTIGALKIYCKVNEVVSAILLNWIILYIVGALIFKYNLDETSFSNGVFKSLPIHESFAFWQGGNFWGWQWSIGVTVVSIIVIWVILKFTVFGHKLKTTGQSPFAAQNFGYNKNALQLWSFAISGILSGILAAIVYTASYTRSIDFQSAGGTALNKIPTQGFDGIAIGLIALNNPLATVIVSFIFTFPSVGAIPAGLPQSTVQLVVGIMMYIVAIYTLLNYFKPWRSIVKAKYEKANNENYMNLENAIFERNERFIFECKKIKNKIIDTKIKQSLSSIQDNKALYNFVKNVFYKPFWSMVLPIADVQYKTAVQEAKSKYALDRKEIDMEFKTSCIISLLDYWKHDAVIKNGEKIKTFNTWNKNKQKIKTWYSDVLNSNSEISQLNIEKQFELIEEKINHAGGK